VVMTGAGALLWWMARATASGGLGRNEWAGIRLPSTMASDEAWLAAHRRALRPNTWAAVVSAACGVITLAPVPMPLVLGGVLLGCLALLGFVLYGAYVGRNAAMALSAGER